MQQYAVSLTIIEANLLTPSENDIGNIVPRIIGGQIANLGEFKGVVRTHFLFVC